MTNNQTEKIKSQRFVVRMPDVVHRQLRKLAENNHRSLNAEINHRLKASISDSNCGGNDPTDVLGLSHAELKMLRAFRSLSKDTQASFSSVIMELLDAKK